MSDFKHLSSSSTKPTANISVFISFELSTASNLTIVIQPYSEKFVLFVVHKIKSSSAFTNT